MKRIPAESWEVESTHYPLDYLVLGSSCCMLVSRARGPHPALPTAIRPLIAPGPTSLTTASWTVHTHVAPSSRASSSTSASSCRIIPEYCRFHQEAPAFVCCCSCSCISSSHLRIRTRRSLGLASLTLQGNIPAKAPRTVADCTSEHQQSISTLLKTQASAALRVNHPSPAIGLTQ